MLKAVQAAVSLGAPEIQFHVERELVNCSFVPARQNFDIAAVAESPDLAYLFQSVQSALSQSPVSVTLSAREQQIVWQNQQRNSTHTAPHTGITLAVKFPSSGFFASLLPSTQTLHFRDQLAQHCSLCPIPVLLEGKILNQLAPEKLRDLQCKNRPGGFDGAHLGPQRILLAGRS